MGDHLGEGPVEVMRVARDQTVRRLTPRPHHRGEDQHVERDIERPVLLVVCGDEMGQGRIAFGAGRLRDAEGAKRLGRDDPGRDRGLEALRQERAERANSRPGYRGPTSR
jgi:hypothetical protein